MIVFSYVYINVDISQFSFNAIYIACETTCDHPFTIKPFYFRDYFCKRITRCLFFRIHC